MKTKEFKADIISLILIGILSIIIISASKFIFVSGYLKDNLYKNVEYYNAMVTEVSKEKLEDDKYIEDIKLGYQEVTLKMLDGPFKDKKYKITNNISRLYNTPAEPGSKVIVAAYLKDNEITDISISSFKRSHILAIMSALFLLIILIIGRFKGLKSIAALIFTMVSVIYLMLPMILRGISPMLSSSVVALISITATLVLVSGLNMKSFSAILGTLSGVLLSGILAYIFGEYANLSGINMQDAESMMYIAENTGLKIHGLMFAGILVSSLGAVMDVGMSISSSIFEINYVNENMTKTQLFKSGMNIGRDIIGTMSNTLILAFAGGSLTTLILIYSSNMNSTRFLNLDIIGTEVIQGLAGSIGILLTVPITAAISAYLCKRQKLKLEVDEINK